MNFFSWGPSTEEKNNEREREREKKIPFPGFSIRHKDFYNAAERKIESLDVVLDAFNSRGAIAAERKKRARIGKMSAWGHIQSLGGKRFQDGGRQRPL